MCIDSPPAIQPLPQASVVAITILSPPPQSKKKRTVHALGQALQLLYMLIIIVASGRIAKVTQSSMDDALEEVAQANAAVREKVVAPLNSMILDPLPFSPYSSNLKVSKLTSTLPGGVVADVSKDTSAVAGDASMDSSSEHL